MTSPESIPRSGIHVTRRATLHGSLALPAAWMLRRLALQESAEIGKSGVEAVLQRWADKTSALVAEEEPNDEAHLFELCADLARLDPRAFPPRKRVTFENEAMKSGPVFVAMPFLVIQFDMEPGAEIPPHNHVGWDFVSMGVRGEATVRHFEPVGAFPDPGKDLQVDFPVREVTSCVLTAGRTSSLTRTRANIHGFRAGAEGATFLDFGVRFPDPGAGYGAVSSLELDGEPRDRARRVHTARWLGNIYAKD